VSLGYDRNALPRAGVSSAIPSTVTYTVAVDRRTNCARRPDIKITNQERTLVRGRDGIY